MTRSIRWSIIALLAGCAGTVDAPSVELTQAALGVTLNGAPAGIDCISFTLTSEDGTVTSYQFTTTGPRRLAILNVAVGAYDLTAEAWGSGLTPPITDAQCAAVPPIAPWATEAPVAVVVLKNQRTDLNVTLVETGRIRITPTFESIARPIASGQGAVGSIAAAGDLVAWTVGGQGASGAIIGYRVGSKTTFTIAGNQTNPGEIVIDGATETVYWDNSISGARDGNGNRIADGSVWRWNPAIAPEQLRAGFAPGDIGFTSNLLFWGDQTHGTIECYPCGAPFAANQFAPNALGVNGDTVFWNTNHPGDGPADLFGEPALGGPVTDLAPVAGLTTVGISADANFAYYSNDTGIQRVPVGGGATVEIATTDTEPFPVTAFDGFVYYLDSFGGNVHRVSPDGATLQDLTNTGGVAGFAVTLDAAGHHVLYWTDPSHGGVVWTGRID